MQAFVLENAECKEKEQPSTKTTTLTPYAPERVPRCAFAIVDLGDVGRLEEKRSPGFLPSLAWHVEGKWMRVSRLECSSMEGGLGIRVWR